jgi:adenylate cyclase
VHLHVGEFAVARDHFIRAMRLSPIDPEFGTFQLGLAIALLWGDPPEPESALGLANQALDALPRHYVGLQVRIYCLVTLGRVAQAKQTAQVLLDAYPNASLSSWRRRWAYSSEELKEKLVEAYRLAGIPE